jgi:Domain of unknown function (DUF4404)
MILDRIEQIEATLKDAPSVPPETRAQLLQLLGELRSEVEPLAGTHADDARSIAQFAEASWYETTRSEKRPKLADAALGGLASSVEGFEASHPRLVETVNRLATTLSNMGI